MASIRQRGQRWQARITRNGEAPVARSFSTKGDAERWARMVEREMDVGAWKPKDQSSTTTLGNLLARYREHITPLHKGSAVEAIRLQAMERSPLASLTLQACTPAKVAEYRDLRLQAVSGPSVLRELQILSAVWNHAVREWSVQAPNPVAAIRKPAPSRGRTRVLDQGETDRLFEALSETRNPWISPLVRLALATAMRRSELLALTWPQVDLQRRTAFVAEAKNGHSRHVPLSPAALEVLAALPRSPDARVFPTTTLALRRCFERARERAGLRDLHFHDLRHCATTRLAQSLSNTLELGAVTGHRDQRMLARYYHASPEALAAKLAGQSA
ncbi:MAG: site-specific integrase [Proteobacteria bacterium]|nr:site-specific integrase [Pseudomonadota bacterium]